MLLPENEPQGPWRHLLETQGQGALHKPGPHGLAGHVQRARPGGAVVVDVEAVLVEVADIDVVAIDGLDNLPVFLSYTGNRALPPRIADYMLFFLNFNWENPVH